MLSYGLSESPAGFFEETKSNVVSQTDNFSELPFRRRLYYIASLLIHCTIKAQFPIKADSPILSVSTRVVPQIGQRKGAVIRMSEENACERRTTFLVPDEIHSDKKAGMRKAEHLYLEYTVGIVIAMQCFFVVVLWDI